MLRLARFGTALALIVLVAACDSGEGSSLYDPDVDRNPAPVIASVSPQGIVLAGVDVVTIEGQNFSATPTDNAVVFDDAQGNSAPGTILSASATRLEVRVPNLPSAALRLRVAVLGSQDYSNAVSFPLTAAVVPFGELSQTEVPSGIAADADGTLYLSLAREEVAVGVIQIAADGTRSDYFDSTFPWSDLAFAGDQLVGVRRVRAVFGLPEGGSQQVLSAFQPSSLSLVAIAGSPDGSTYAGGNAQTLFRVAPDGPTSETALPTTVRALAAAGGQLYVVSGGTGPGRIYSLPIASDGSLGAPTAIADLPAVGNAVAVATDGTLFVGLDRVVDPVVTVSPAGDVSPLYPGVLRGPASALAYGAGSQLYMVRGASADQRADVLLIETRREGAR
ncbi:IPT/TIG domain-containing protein [Rubrivirga sp.]|uniref:IPT/TIG domain-containing protein n=1 Tax=Rubrivirga sp. TaxID=1885344 RepID=UPI003B5225FE